MFLFSLPPSAIHPVLVFGDVFGQCSIYKVGSSQFLEMLIMLDFILSHVSSLMSISTTPVSSPQRNTSASWKRKYELLEAQFATMSKEPNSTSKRQAVPYWCSTTLTALSPIVLQLDRYRWVEVSVAL